MVAFFGLPVNGNPENGMPVMAIRLRSFVDGQNRRNKMAPQHIIQYNLPNDKADLDAAMNGEKWKAIVSMLYSKENDDGFFHLEDQRKEIDEMLNNLNLKL